MQEPHFRYFGYGSLVNRRTLPDGVPVVAGRLVGYRRAWRAASHWHGRGVCALSIEPAAGAEIDGVMVAEPVSRLAALDAREQRYNRHLMPGHLFVPAAGTASGAAGSGAAGEGAPDAGDFFVYRAGAAANRFGDAARPIWLSYVDVVLQGFLDLFGEEGVRRFVATTDGWHVPIVDDRSAPAYPPAQRLSPAETAVVDAALAAVGARPAHLSEIAGAQETSASTPAPMA